MEQVTQDFELLTHIVEQMNSVEEERFVKAMQKLDVNPDKVNKAYNLMTPKNLFISPVLEIFMNPLSSIFSGVI